MMESTIKSFGVVKSGSYYADLGGSIRDIFGFDFDTLGESGDVFLGCGSSDFNEVNRLGSGFRIPSRNSMICLKRGEDGNDCYRYAFYGFVSKSVVRLVKYKKSDCFKFPEVLQKELGICKDDTLLYVYYSGDGSIVMSKKEPEFYDCVEKITFGGSNMFVSRSMDVYMMDSFYAAVAVDGGFILVPIGSAMWSFINVKSGRYNFLIENIYDFVVRRELGTESVIIRYYGECPRMFEVLNNVGH